MTVPKLHIEAVQTIPPTKVTDPRLTQNVSVANTSLIASDSFRGCLNVVLYYNNKASEEDSGWFVAGLIKESLGMALTEQPFLAGRLRQREDCDEKYEVVSNDSGVRLVEAKMDMNLSEFLDLKGQKKDAVEAQLVFWKEIDPEHPQYSPLFYVQVTNFECGGYSVGISCSLLLADNVVMTKFLKTWGNIHEQVLSKSDLPRLPIFYVPNFKKVSSSPTIPAISTCCHRRGQTMMFQASLGQNPSSDTCKMLSLLCVEEAEHNLEHKLGSEFSLLIKEGKETIKIENCSQKDRVLYESENKLESEISDASWESLGAKEVAFIKGSNPSDVSYWIGSISGGVVITLPSDDKGCSGVYNVIVTILTDY